MTEYALEIENIEVSYAASKVLDNVSLTIQQAEFFGLAGVNGAGKTTLIKTILGLRQPDSGQIKIFGTSVTDKATKDRIAYLPERFEPPWFLTGIEFLKFSIHLYGEQPNIDAIEEAAQTIGLSPEVLGNRVHTYSKGMRQKLGLLGTLCCPADVLILDEPMSGLDPLARSKVKDMLIKVKKEKKTILICSHILADMDEICDRMSVLDQSQIQFIGTPNELKKNAKTDFLERAFLNYIQQDKKAHLG